MLGSKKFSLAFFSWMVFVTWASLSTFPEDDAPHIKMPHFDKVVHFGFYFGAVVLGTLSVREISKGLAPLARSLVYVMLGAIVFGLVIEVLQYAFTLDRQGDVWDAFANSCGALVGALAMGRLFSRGSRLKWK